MNEKLWIPEKLGSNYDLKTELLPIKEVRQHINLFSRHRVDLEGRSPFPHISGWVLLRCGQVPATQQELPRESIDVTVADAVGVGTRFRSLELTATGDSTDSYSFNGPAAVNPPEISPVDLYTRVFGPEFQDPNASTFTPSPRLMLRESVLSAVREEGASLLRKVGSADRERLDAYFTSLRGMEERLALQMQKPPPALACHVPGASPRELPVGQDIEVVQERHRIMTDILVMALACNQTRVFNMVYSAGGANTTKRGLSSTHHVLTHEELFNAGGYQEMHSWFVRRAMEAWAYFVSSLAAVREGDGSLLDNTLVYAHTEHDNAQVHGFRGIPMMTAGRAGGRIRSGIHVDGGHQALASKLGLTVLHAMGLDLPEWGTGAMRTTETISEIQA